MPNVEAYTKLLTSVLEEYILCIFRSQSLNSSPCRCISPFGVALQHFSTSVPVYLPRAEWRHKKTGKKTNERKTYTCKICSESMSSAGHTQFRGQRYCPFARRNQRCQGPQSGDTKRQVDYDKRPIFFHPRRQRPSRGRLARNKQSGHMSVEDTKIG